MSDQPAGEAGQVEVQVELSDLLRALFPEPEEGREHVGFLVISFWKNSPRRQLALEGSTYVESVHWPDELGDVLRRVALEYLEATVPRPRPLEG